MSTSRKAIAKLDTNDFSDCANTGYTFTLYADGRITAEYHSRWQGSVDGRRYTTEPGALEVDDSITAEEQLAEYVRNMDATPEEDIEHGGRFQTWRVTQSGYTVR